MITITQKIGKSRKYMDIQVNENQKIMDTLQVLFQAGLIQSEDVSAIEHIYSDRNKQFVNTRLTYNQAMIFNGDMLIHEGGEREHER